MFRVGVECNEMDLNVFPEAIVIGVDNCLEWCNAGESIDCKVAADEGAGGGGAAGNNNAPDENDGVDVCR